MNTTTLQSTPDPTSPLLTAAGPEVSCLFRPLAREMTAFGSVAAPVRRHRQRPGLALSHVNFDAPTTAKNPQPFRWPLQSHVQAGVLMRGRIDFQLPDQGSVTVLAGQWFVAAVGQGNIDCRARGAVELLWFDCSEAIWREFIAGTSTECQTLSACISCERRDEHLVVSGEASTAVTQLAGDLAANQGDTIGDRLRLEARSLEFLALLLEQPRLHDAPQPAPCSRNIDAEALDAAARLLEDNLSEEHSLRAISRAVHLNEFKLKQGFRQRFQTTVFGYLRQKRMEHARRLLTELPITVLDAATRVGYSNPSHFARAFREAFGLSPREVARRSRE